MSSAPGEVYIISAQVRGMNLLGQRVGRERELNLPKVRFKVNRGGVLTDQKWCWDYKRKVSE